MTDEQVIKALEQCGNIIVSSCKDCPLHEKYNANCVRELTKESLDLINRQQAEIDDLKAEIEKRCKAWSEDIYDKIKVIHEQNEQLDDLRLEKYGIEVINKAVPTTKAVKRYIELKAYKEFADLFKQEMRNCANAEFDGIKYYLIGEEFINRRVKELTEGSNGE